MDTSSHASSRILVSYSRAGARPSQQRLSTRTDQFLAAPREVIITSICLHAKSLSRCSWDSIPGVVDSPCENNWKEEYALSSRREALSTQGYRGPGIHSDVRSEVEES